MPRGSKPGERPGGRQKGVPNKRTTERLEQERIARQAQQEVDKAHRANVKLGKEILEDYMMAFHAIAAVHQNKVVVAMQKGIAPAPADVAEFKEWGILTARTAKDLAEFQSPKFKAIAVVAPPPSAPEPPKTIDGKVVDLNDPRAIARVYTSMVKKVVG